jgi:phage/plasmid primase-like uncharacterized protein
LLDEESNAHPHAPDPAVRIRADHGDEERMARVARIWAESSPIAGAVAERYLRERAIEGELPGPDVLRFHPRMTSLEDRERRPALVASLVDAHGALQGVQVTLLTTHGAAKAPLATPRRTIGRLIGHYVRIDAPADVLIVAEGLETALSARRALGAGAWALLSADNLAQFEPPRVIDKLVIAADHDEAGLMAAKRLQARASHIIATEIALPPDGFSDWNDWARGQRG